MKVELRESPPLSVDEALAHVTHPGAGGVSVFLGMVRDHNDGHAVSLLEYHAYASMAKAELQRIAQEVEAEVPGARVAAMHRLGKLAVGDVAVVCAASAQHRGEAFTACRALIERIKARVPIWKREHGPDGALWVGWVDARCAADEGGHGKSHVHRHEP
jgi:molybdopterin synthase catalytic subunit